MFPHTTGIENVVLLKRKMMSLTPNRTPDKKGDKKLNEKVKLLTDNIEKLSSARPTLCLK